MTLFCSTWTLFQFSSILSYKSLYLALYSTSYKIICYAAAEIHLVTCNKESRKTVLNWKESLDSMVLIIRKFWNSGLLSYTKNLPGFITLMMASCACFGHNDWSLLKENKIMQGDQSSPSPILNAWCRCRLQRCWWSKLRLSLKFQLVRFQKKPYTIFQNQQH